MVGRPRKTISEVLRDQTFRADRHADRLRAAESNGPSKPPTRPRSLKGEARKLWDVLVKELAGVVGPRDAASLVMLCTSYAAWLKTSAKLEELEPGTTEHARTTRALKGLFETYEKLAAKFGLDPISRERLPQLATTGELSEKEIEQLQLQVKYQLAGHEQAAEKLRRAGVAATPARPKTKLDREGPPKGATDGKTKSKKANEGRDADTDAT